jgi:hypothetical protein
MTATADPADRGDRSEHEVRLPRKLAGLLVPTLSWAPRLAAALRTILASPPADAHCFTSVSRYRAEHLAALVRQDSSGDELRPDHTFDRYKLAETLIGAASAPGRSRGVKTLLWLLLELILRGDMAEHIDRLASNLRGSFRASNRGPLAEAIGECAGLEELIVRMRFRLAAAEDGGADAIGHPRMLGVKSFDDLWVEALGRKCELILAAGDDTAEEADEEDAEEARTLSEGLLHLALEEDEDESEDRAIFEVDADVYLHSPDKQTELQLAAWGRELYRRSSSALLRPTDNICPAHLVQGEWRRLVEAARHALAAGDTELVEAHLLVLLAIEAGLSDAEARSLIWARADLGGCGIPRIDARLRALIRPDLRPSEAFEPNAGDSRWQTACGFVAFPLSRAVLEIGVGLRWQRSRQAHMDRNNGPCPEGWLQTQDQPRPVSAALSKVGNPLNLTAATLRRRLAAHIASDQGTDVAQIALGDSFGVGHAPTYYMAFDVRSFAERLCLYTESVTGARPGLRWRGLAQDLFAGSRVRPTGRPLEGAWRMVGAKGDRGRGRPGTRTFVAEMRARRDALAMHLMLATGHRPVSALAKMRLSQFAPSHALVVLSDKQSDPAHHTRIASTGWRFQGALESYVRELQRIASSPDLRRFRRGALEVLAGERPLFDAPTDDGGWHSLEVSSLLKQLPDFWQSCRNVHRHMLCQWLGDRGVHPELRHFQLGWLAHPMHATSTASPRPATGLTRELADLIDEWLVAAGWEGGGASGRNFRHWDGPLLLDFSAHVQQHLKDCRESQAKLEARLSDRDDARLPSILAQLQRAVRATKLGLDLSIQDGTATLISKVDTPAARPVRLGARFVEAAVEAISRRDERALARRVLVKILVRARKQGLIQATLPKLPAAVPQFSPSPFVPILGVALLAAERVREGLPKTLATSAELEGLEGTRRLLSTTVLAIVSCTAYRRLEDAYAIATQAAGAQRSRNLGEILRVPWGEGHVVLSGLPALLAARLGARPDLAEALKQSPEQRQVALRRLLGEIFPRESAMDRKALLDRVQTALLLAGEVELEGPARVLMRREVLSATVAAVRAASASDGITIAQIAAVREEVAESFEDPSGEVPDATARKSWHPSTHATLQLLNPNYVGDIGGLPAPPLRGRRPALLRALQGVLATLDSSPTLRRWLLAYAQALLEPDRRIEGRGLAISTVYKIVNRVSRALKQLSEEQGLDRLEPNDWMAVLLPYLRDPGAGDRVDVLKEVRRFLAYLQEHIHVCPPDWGLLFAAAGETLPPWDPALIADAEAERVVEALVKDVESDDPEPSFMEHALRRTRLAFALVLEASGVRPGSAEGLTLADVYLDPSGDYVRLRTRGRYARVKTRTSEGFVPLEGEIWHRHRDTFQRWLLDLQSMVGVSEPASVPLLQIPREPLGMRFQLDALTQRIGDLIRWATQDGRARVYHLRKRRLQLRHLRLRALGTPRTLDVARVLRISGHVSISTAIASYLGDPVVYLAEPRELGTELSLREAAAVAGRSVAGVHARWVRKLEGADSSARAEASSGLMSLSQVKPTPWPEVDLPPPPRLTNLAGELDWRSVGWALESFAAGEVDDLALPTRWMSAGQWRQIRSAAKELELRVGRRFRFGQDTLCPPRASPVWRLLEQLIEARDDGLLRIAREWARRALYRRSGTAILLVDEEAIEALTRLAQELDLRVEVEEEGPPRHLTLRGRDGQTAYGLANAMRWALAVAWVSHAVSCDVRVGELP